jgi:hypothetical protein
MYGQRSTYLDAVHGFVATASPLIRGRHLLDAQAWAAWQQCIVNTVEHTASWEGEQANWRGWLAVARAVDGRERPQRRRHPYGRPAQARQRRTDHRVFAQP